MPYSRVQLQHPSCFPARLSVSVSVSVSLSLLRHTLTIGYGSSSSANTSHAPVPHVLKGSESTCMPVSSCP